MISILFKEKKIDVQTQNYMRRKYTQCLSMSDYLLFSQLFKINIYYFYNQYKKLFRKMMQDKSGKITAAFMINS